MNRPVLIADAGGTSVTWALVDDNETVFVPTDGINPTVTPRDKINRIVNSVPVDVDCHVGIIRYYGAGCRDSRSSRPVYEALARRWPDADISVESDLVGAATALFGRQQGIACILGTGSNSGVWSGNAITANTPSMGYILGDEGSGADIGKAFVNALYKGRLDRAVSDDAEQLLGYSLSEIIESVYRGDAPNRFLASLCPAILELSDNHEQVAGLVIERFRAFVDNNLAPYGEQAAELPLGFVGSIAMNFEHLLRQAVNNPIEDIIDNPLPSLCRQLTV